ncbi:MAG: pyruvate synthase subunit beta [Candidatus Hydrogenedens sp.]|jgi:pyruvate ferredoxin oxidoreductase beta subunit|nr:pyruvate synthase subunit beta [Candidatus Hydrogenedens sp.]
MATNILSLPEQEFMLPGNRACAGCSIGIIFRHVTKALDGKAAFVVPASCFTVLCGMYPSSSVTVPIINSVFPGTAACASGLAASLERQGKTDMTVVAMAGDGGTADIGIQALSGAAERGANILFICYDNEAYMNTGTQRSGMTPLAARTSTTPTLGKIQPPKDMPAILEAHGIPYIATASPGYPTDLYDKVQKARDIRGTRYMHLSAPCPAGWHYEAKDTVAMAKLAVETGTFILAETVEGVYRLTGRSLSMAKAGKRKPVREFIRTQGRFSRSSEEALDELQQWVDNRWEAAVHRHETS